MTRKRTAVLISGGGTNLQALIDAALDPAFPAEITLVLSNKADAYGLTRAMQAGIPTEVIPHKPYPTREAFDDAMHAMLVKNNIELVCLAGFMRLLSDNFVRRWEGRMINIHPSLLPSFKGLDTHARAIEAGVRFTGCTVHFVVPEMDSGPIIIQAAVPVHAGDTTEALAARVLGMEHQIYPAALRLLAENRLSVQGNQVRVTDYAAPKIAGMTNP